MDINTIIDKAAHKMMEFDLAWCYNIDIIKDQMLWVPYALPKIIQSEKHLFFACTSSCYLFYLDDAKTKYADYNETATEIHRRKLVMHDTAFDYKKYGVVYYYERLMQQTLNPFNYELFHSDLLNYIPTEDIRNKKIKFDTIGEYLDKRCINVFGRAFFVVLFDALGLNYPMEYNEYFVKATHSFAVANDLHSYTKELREEEPYNALVVLQQKNNDIKENLSHLTGLINNNLLESFKIEDKLIREILIAAQIGNVVWHTLSSRYKAMQKIVLCNV